MQKVEIWRVKELGLVLLHLSELLKKSDQQEWANVFQHYHAETQKIILGSEVDPENLRRLSQNIKNCFHGMSSLKNLILQDEIQGEDEGIHLNFERWKARLLKILEEIEKRTTEYIH